MSIVVRGQGGHGSAPDKVRDPITAGLMIHRALHSIRSRSIDSKENIVFSICHFESGTTSNVFPDEAFMEGTIRSYDAPTLERMKSRIREVAT
mmetsp:Transcript_2411/g.4099  ORF Transcript_2411/g.4099 Transcript_2411/m.4099 type:complete len:93 (-) Transcript_2411:361-639(-)